MLFATKLSETAKIPERHSQEAAGCDIYSNASGVIQPKSKALIPTGISINVPENHVAMIYGRSGLSNKYQLEVANACIHPNDKKELILYFYNNGSIPFEYKMGERVAQVVFLKTGGNIEIIN